MLFAQKVFAIMEACVCLYVTNQSASVQQGSLEKAVKSMLMNAPASLATMVVPVSILLKVIDANVPLDLLDCNVMKRIATVIRYHLYAQNEPCAETSQDLETLVVYVDQDTQSGTTLEGCHSGCASLQLKVFCLSPSVNLKPTSHVATQSNAPVFWPVHSISP